MKKLLLTLIVLCIGTTIVFSQEKSPINISTISRDEVLKLTIDDLSSLSIEDLMKAIEIAGVSSADELYALLNKNLSSASKKTESQLESPLSTTVISQQELISSGATCIEEALRMVPGVIVRQKTNGNYDVHLRGNDNLPTNNMLIYSENTKTLVMVNGRPVFNYAFGGIMWETLPVNFDEIDRIEVVRGPASALYGSNAVTGAINIITKSSKNITETVTGNFSGGTRMMSGNVGVNKTINSKMSVGINGNIEKRTRDDEKIYLFQPSNKAYLNGNEFTEGYYTVNDYDKLTQSSPLGTQVPVKDPDDPIDELFEDINLSRQTASVNAQFQYEPSSKTNISFTTGFQDSYVNTSSMGDAPTSMGGRKSTTGYGDLTMQMNKLTLKGNYTMGAQDFATGDEGVKVDMTQMNLSAEYDFQYKSLTVRPGVSYQNASYNDKPYLSVEGGGYFNGEKNLSTLAGSIRFDYVMFDKLRLIAALRTEKYSKPDEWHQSWQFVGSYPISDNQTVRAVYSRANQSSFMINTESNYLWDRTARKLLPSQIYFGGNKNYDLMQMDMIELGYRIKPSKALMIDFEAYYNISKNFGALMPSSTTLDPTYLSMGIVLPTRVDINYKVMDLESKQIGASININWIASSKLMFKGHLNCQQTTLDNYSKISRDEVIINQIMEAAGQAKIYSTDYENGVKYKYTPAFYGNLGVEYRPIEKLQFYADVNFIDKQTFNYQYGNMDMNAKATVNLKATYKINKNIDVFVNGRNILNDKTREFAYMDRIGATYLGGIHVKF